MAFLASHLLLRDWVRRKFGNNLKPITEGANNEGAFYLFPLRMVPQFLVVNLAVLRYVGLTMQKPHNRSNSILNQHRYNTKRDKNIVAVNLQ